MKRGWKAGLVIVLGGLMAVGTGRNVVKLYQAGNRVKEAQRQLDEAKLKNEVLKKRLAEVNSPEFIEREAREKLGYGKDGEVLLILPKQKELESVRAGESKSVANWRKWWDLYIRL